MSSHRVVMAGLLASAFIATPFQPAFAGGGDFVGGVISGVILKSVIDESAKPRRTYRAPRQTVRRVQDPAVTQYWRGVQNALNDAGYNVGRADGIPGQRTRAGVRDFQRSIGAEPTGSLSPDEYAALQQAAGYTPDPALTRYGEPDGPSDTVGGPIDSPEPGAIPTAPVVSTSAPALAPGAADALSAFDAPKRMNDAALDDVAANTSVLGIGIGSPRAEAEQAFEDGVGNCRATGTYTTCIGGNDSYTDDVSFATAGTDDAAPVYFVTRTLGFTQPVPADALRSKLSESLQPITDAPGLVVSSSGDCDRSLDGEGAAVMSASLRSYARGSDGEALADVSGKCRAFFAITMDGKDDAISRVTVRLYDGRMLEPLPGAQAAAAPAAAAPAATPAADAALPDVKF